MGLLNKKISPGLLAPGHGMLGRSGGSSAPGTSSVSTAGQAIGLLLALTKAS